MRVHGNHEKEIKKDFWIQIFLIKMIIMGKSVSVIQVKYEEIFTCLEKAYKTILFELMSICM